MNDSMNAYKSNFPDPAAVHLMNQEHIADLSLCAQDGPWSFSCFYAYVPDSVSIIYKSQPESFHSGQLQLNSGISGSIRNSTREIDKIRGIQFSGTAMKINPAFGRKTDDIDIKQHVRAYESRFPFASEFPGDYWIVLILKMKFTDNTIRFGYKSVWEKMDR